MKKDLTLLILAAGLGSRFGSLKQIEPFGPSGEFIIDYSIYDAIKAGFNKVVFVIKEENYQIFKESIGKRIEKHIKVEYVFQSNNNIPSEYDLSSRTKPLGTAHAVLCAKDAINEDFVMINSDDFYGRESFDLIKDYMLNRNDKEFGIVGYNVSNTLSDNGSVKRGLLKDNNGYLEDIVESVIEEKDSKVYSKPLYGAEEEIIDKNSLVSMNMIGFTTEIFKFLEDGLKEFLEINKDDLSDKEFLIPNMLTKSIANGFKCKIIPTNANWMGVTYKSDTDNVKNKIKSLIEEGVYPNDLWKNN